MFKKIRYLIGILKDLKKPITNKDVGMAKAQEAFHNRRKGNMMTDRRAPSR